MLNFGTDRYIKTKDIPKNIRKEREHESLAGGMVHRLHVDGYVVPTLANVNFAYRVFSVTKERCNKLSTAVRWLTALVIVDIAVSVLVSVSLLC